MKTEKKYKNIKTSKAHQMFFVRTMPEEFQNTTIASQLCWGKI